MHLMPLNHILKHGKDGKCYNTWFLLQLKKNPNSGKSIVEKSQA